MPSGGPDTQRGNGICRQGEGAKINRVRSHSSGDPDRRSIPLSDATLPATMLACESESTWTVLITAFSDTMMATVMKAAELDPAPGQVLRRICRPGGGGSARHGRHAGGGNCRKERNSPDQTLLDQTLR